MCIINEGGNRPSPIGSGELRPNVVKNSAKIEILKAENDKRDTVDSNVHFEIPPAKARFLPRWTYKIQIGTDLTKTVLRLTACLGATGERASLINEGLFETSMNMSS